MTTHPSIVNQDRILEPKIQWKKSIFQTLRSRGWSDIHAQPIQNHRIIKGCKSQEIHSFMHSNISPEFYHILETNTFLDFLIVADFPLCRLMSWGPHSQDFRMSLFGDRGFKVPSEAKWSSFRAWFSMTNAFTRRGWFGPVRWLSKLRGLPPSLTN